MPTVLRAGGFVVRIYLPPREHGPAHVHVVRGGAVVLIDLNTPEIGVSIREILGMSRPDVHRAIAIVAAHGEELRTAWRRYHGE